MKNSGQSLKQRDEKQQCVEENDIEQHAGEADNYYPYKSVL